MTNHPFPVKFNDSQRVTIETIKGTLHGFPSYSEILRSALDLGLKHLSTLPIEDLAKEIKGK